MIENSEHPGPRSSNSQKLGRLTLGSALMAMDTVSQRLERLEAAEGQQPIPRRTLDDVLVPVARWPDQFGVTVDRPARHLMLGMMVDARSRAGAANRLANGLGIRLARTIHWLLRPVQDQPLFRPVRRGFDKAVERGDTQVARWRALGRAEDARSRALAGSALSRAAADTLDGLAGNERVDVFIQEIVESQTAGIVDEIVEEIRERAVSSDNFFERPVRRLFRRPVRSGAPQPAFDPRLVRPILRRGLPVPAGSLLGHNTGFVSRLLALFVDVVLTVLVLALGSSLFTTAVDVLGLQAWVDSLTGAGGVFTGIFAAASGLLVVTGYLVLSWLLTGQTLGMMLMGLRVVNRAGGRLSWWQAVLRLAGYLLLPGVFFFGFLWILGDDRREAWHDKLARTWVVYAWDARPDETFLADMMDGQQPAW